MMLLIGLATLAPGGCSFKLAIPPPPPSDWPRPVRSSAADEQHCTPTLIPPLLDTTVVLLLASLAYVERNSASSFTPYVLGAAALPVAVSAGYGFVVSVECRRYQRRFAPPE